MGFLDGKRALITGIASKRSIAWGIAQSMAREGAELAFTYMGDRLKGRVEKVAEELGADPALVLPCNVESDAEIEALFGTLQDKWGRLDTLVHSIAFARSEELTGDYLDNVTRDGFNTAHEISSYSFAALAKGARPLMREHGGAMVAMTYLGAERILPNYNVMGLAKASLEAGTRYMAGCMGPENIRVNAISAGPIKTLAAAGIGDFRMLLEYMEKNAPLRRNVTIEQVGDTAAFLCSDLSAGITGQVIYVDSGFNITAMPYDK